LVRRGQQLLAVTTAAIKPTSPRESPSFENRGQVQLDAKNLRVSMVQFNIVMNVHECNYRFARRPESAIYDALLF
jgi:hypothetical protein